MGEIKLLLSKGVVLNTLNHFEFSPLHAICVQAEDGIRDIVVAGVETYALPISLSLSLPLPPSLSLSPSPSPSLSLSLSLSLLDRQSVG